MKRLLTGTVAVIALSLSALLAPAAAGAAEAPAATDSADLSATASVSSVATMTSTVTVSIDGRSFRARLVQPEGDAPGAYPVVAFGHGFLQSSSRYASTLDALASRGYIVIAPDSELSFFPSHSRFADDLQRSLQWVRQTQPNANPILDGVAGHSMGGGAAVIAADRYPEIDSLATLAAAETRPSSRAAAQGVDVDALFVVGSRDSIVRPATTRAIYDAKPAPATFATIADGYHCGFNDSSSFFGLGCDRGGISRATQLSLTHALVGDWFDRTLKGSPEAATPAGVVVESK